MKAKVSLKTVIVSALLLVCGLNASADNKSNLIYNSEEVNGMKVAYQGKTMTTTYDKWNNKKGEYILVPEMTVIMDNPNM